jgi:alpha-ketoglutarate-dependent taurine dioxygenase
VLASTISDARAWHARSIDDRSTWYYRVPERCLAALDEAIRHLRREPCPTTTMRATDWLDAGCHADLAPAQSALESGRGFVIIEGLPLDRYSSAELQAGYWLVGQLLGRPMQQNVQGTLLYDVRDEGKDVRYGARFSVTSAETGFHTDNSFGDRVIDYVGLLCLQTARRGGLNQVVSGYTLHNELRQRYPEELATLYQPFHFDRRGGLRPGDAPTVMFPILHWDGHGLVCRYLRYWIDAGHDKAGQPFTAAQTHALAVLDRTLREPDLQVEFGLKPGDMFIANNRWLFHNRSAFEDYDEPGRRRHYIRLWLEREREAGVSG